MKAMLIVVGAVPLLASPAHADTRPQPTPRQRAAATAPVHEHAVRVAEIAPVAPVAKAAIELPASLAVPPPPALPTDPSSALTPVPGLVRAPPAVVLARHRRAKAKPVVMNFGKSYVLGDRKAATMSVRDVESAKPRSLTRAQVATVVQGHLDMLQACWSALPKSERADEVTAELSLSIAETGTVLSVGVDADVPDLARTCITTAASHWQFPVAGSRTDLEYAVSLRSL